MINRWPSHVPDRHAAISIYGWSTSSHHRGGVWADVWAEGSGDQPLQELQNPGRAVDDQIGLGQQGWGRLRRSDRHP